MFKYNSFLLSCQAFSKKYFLKKCLFAGARKTFHGFFSCAGALDSLASISFIILFLSRVPSGISAISARVYSRGVTVRAVEGGVRYFQSRSWFLQLLRVLIFRFLRVSALDQDTAAIAAKSHAVVGRVAVDKTEFHPAFRLPVAVAILGPFADFLNHIFPLFCLFFYLSLTITVFCVPVS